MAAWLVAQTVTTNGDTENARHENARNAIVWNTACCICLSIAEQECMSRQERAPDFLSVHLRRRICAKCVSSSNVMHDLRLCHVGISDSVRRASPT